MVSTIGFIFMLLGWNCWLGVVGFVLFWVGIIKESK